MHSFRIDTVRWQMQNFTYVVPCIYFALARAISEILTFQIDDLQKVGHFHRVQFLNDAIRWPISKSAKVILYIFLLSLRYDLFEQK